MRTSPNSVSCLHAEAWQELYGHHRGDQHENVHLPGFFNEARQGVIAADTGSHAHQRRILAPGFSATTMQRQEPLITTYVDLLFKRLREQAEKREAIDMVRWLNYFTFDVIGDLSFGESFGMLERSGYHEWIKNLLGFFHTQYILANFRRAYPLLEALITPILKLSAANVIRAHNSFVDARIAHRLGLESSRPDFVEAMIAPDDHGKPVCQLVTSGYASNMI